ncbi:Ku protein [Streptomyces syringium]|uniref:non-homologous end joining protein Ku n=1 Tax=Streptomyces syringium TaxID=76729 RepID=UPI0036884EAF
MPRAMWAGAIGFGLVSVPVRLVPAVEEHGLRLHQVHDKDRGRIRQERVCEVCGEVVPYEHLAKAFESDEKKAVLTDEDLADLPLPSKKLIDVLAFVDSEEIDSIQLDRPYLLAPASAAANKAYVLLRETLKQTDRVAVTKITISTRESLALLRVHDDLLAVHTMVWPGEVRDPAGLAPPESVTVRPQEIEMAASLMERMSADFDLESLSDAYRSALEDLVMSKIQDRPAPTATQSSAAPSNVVDLMAALQASIDRADSDSTATSSQSKTGTKKTPATKAAKAPAKKTTKASGGRGAAKKTATKKRRTG